MHSTIKKKKKKEKSSRHLHALQEKKSKLKDLCYNICTFVPVRLIQIRKTQKLNVHKFTGLILNLFHSVYKI